MNPIDRCRHNHPSQQGRNERIFNDIVNDYYTNHHTTEEHTIWTGPDNERPAA